MIPLLLEEIPTAKEFKDAVKSLSPEQQRFARAYRKMQLSTSVFAVCVIQVKPALETLLGLPADALDKEMKLTKDLMELFIEHQVPSDLLSYNGFSGGIAVADKLSNVRDNVKGVMDVIEAEKAKQLKAEEAKAQMAIDQAAQRYFDEEDDCVEECAALEDLYEECGPPIRACKVAYTALKSNTAHARAPVPQQFFSHDVLSGNLCGRWSVDPAAGF